MRTPGAKKVFTKTSEQPCHSTREKNVVSQSGYNDYMAYHYAFMMKVATIRELKTFSEAVQCWIMGSSGWEVELELRKGGEPIPMELTCISAKAEIGNQN